MKQTESNTSAARDAGRPHPQHNVTTIAALGAIEEAADRNGWRGPRDFIDHLRTGVIPYLEESGSKDEAEDFSTAADMLEAVLLVLTGRK